MADDPNTDGNTAALLRRNQQLTAQLQAAANDVHTLQVQHNRALAMAWDFKAKADALEAALAQAQAPPPLPAPTDDAGGGI